MSASMLFAIIGVIVAAVLVMALLADRKFKRENRNSMFESNLDALAIAALLVVACFWTGVA